MRLSWLPLVLVILGLGCQEATAPGTMGLRILSGRGQEDTVFTLQPAPLVAEFRDSSGAPRAGVPILFESISSGPKGPEIALFIDTPGQSGLVLSDTTDNNGRVSVRVLFGRTAGLGWVRVSASTFGLSDSASFVVLPGRLARVEIEPADTAMLAGGIVKLRGAFDAWGNERADPIEWSASPPDIVEVVGPGLIKGLRTGRAMVRAHLGTVTDSVGINVVPPGRIAALFYPIIYGEPQYVVLFNTDGSEFQHLDISADCAHGLQWLPTGDRIIFGRNPAPSLCFVQRLYSTTVSGTVQRIRSDTVPLAGEFWPRMTADGQWIYFSGRPDHQNGEIWRVRPDGADAERIGPAAGWYDLDQHPSPSPDGSEVVYASTRLGESGTFLRAVNTTTRAVRDLGITGISPSWSPRGDQIAFLRDDRYYVVALDGSGERPLVYSRYSGGMPDPPSWSPDGNWFVAVVVDPAGYAPLYGRLALIDATSGSVLPLGWTAQLTYPTWRPEPR